MILQAQDLQVQDIVLSDISDIGDGLQVFLVRDIVSEDFVYAHKMERDNIRGDVDILFVSEIIGIVGKLEKI